MAKETSPNQIRDYNDDWSLDTRNGLPYSGSAVQSFIKSNLSQAAGAAWFDANNNVLYFFRNEVDRDVFAEDTTQTELVLSSTAMNFSSTIYRIMLTNNNGSQSIQAATNQEEVILSLDFDIQWKSISGGSDWMSSGDDVVVRAYMDAGATGSYTEIPDVGGLVLAGTTFELNIRQYLASGNNRVRITFTSASDDSVTNSIVYSVFMSEMYVELYQNTWYNAIAEGDLNNYKLGGFRIVGDLYKTLHINIIQANSVVKSFSRELGTNSYPTYGYNFDRSQGLDLSTLGTGIYTCQAWLSAGDLNSTAVSYNFMHVAYEDIDTAKLVCTNNVTTSVVNYSDNVLCEYAIYNGRLATGTPHVEIYLISGGTPTEMVNRDYENMATGVVHSLEYTVEWLINSQSVNIACRFAISFGSSSQTYSVPIDNSKTYPAEPFGAGDFYLNATTRTNYDSNITSIINEATLQREEISANWERMSWVDGIDGWTVDDDGRKALLIPAGSKCTIPYRALTSDNTTIEFCFKIANVSDYNENAITIATDPTSDGFKGIRIRPTGFTIHSSTDVSSDNDSRRGKSFEDEQTVHLLFSIWSSVQSGKNMVTAYVNGCKALQFPYGGLTNWSFPADIVVGSSSADVYLYFCRVYKQRPFADENAEKNYINSLTTISDREIASAWIKSVLPDVIDQHEISYENVVNSSRNYNFFVVEMRNGATIPSRANAWNADNKGYSDLEMHFGEHPEWDWKIENLQTEGQGTTAMNYYRWNIRWRIDYNKNNPVLPVTYYDEPSIGLDNKKQFHPRTATNGASVNFDGEGTHPAVKRITAKINMASSMQAHKMGATLAYTKLHDDIGLENEAQEYASDNEMPKPTVSVYQYPAFGFERKRNTLGEYIYEFIGLFTIGPDKGDKATFGYDISSIKNNLITMEGTNHTKRLALFNYPWNSKVNFLSSNECLNVVFRDSVDDAWEVGNCYGLSPDKIEDESDVYDVLEEEFKPAYDVVYNNSTLIFPVSLSDPNYYGANAAEVLAKIQNNINDFRNTRYNDRFTYADMEFWIEGEYVLYYFDYDPTTGAAKYTAGINLVSDSTWGHGSPDGDTLEEKNEWFKAQRRARFLEQAPDYWDIQDAAFHYAFCVIFGATDNFAKNTYPYKMASIDFEEGENVGGKWKWRQDDLDTIFDIDNLGTDTKSYEIEFGDSKDGSVVFAGSNSVFWNLLHEVFWNNYDSNTKKGIQGIGQDVMRAMSTIGGLSNDFQSILSFFQKYFWDRAQLYFPQSAYNADAKYKYESGWLDPRDAWNQPNALDQSLGRHYEAERLWCTRRIIYIMSLFKFGPFGRNDDTSLGTITFRANGISGPNMTSNMWMYPAMFSGEGSAVSTYRTAPGVAHVFPDVSSGGGTNVYYQATNYMEDIGDWKDMQLDAGYLQSVNINAAKLRQFKIGDETEEVTTNIPQVLFINTKCLEEIDARNAYSLNADLDLSNCTRLLRGYFEGTRITQIMLPNGSKIETLHLSDSTSGIFLRNLKFLTDLGLPSDMATVTTIQVENCENQQAFDLLRQCYASDNSSLKNIRVIWSDIESVTAEDVHMLANIHENKDKDDSPAAMGDYQGITAQGSIGGLPVIEGTVQVQAGLYTNDFVTLNITQYEDYPGGLTRALCSAFGTLYIIYNENLIYINFADDTVRDIVIANWGDGEGITAAAARRVTDIGRKFTLKSAITSFNEFALFSGVTRTVDGAGLTSTNSGAFYNCSNLESITLPSSLTTIGAYTFQACSKLSSINLENVRYINSHAFYGCSALTDLNAPNLTGTIGNLAFAYSGLVTVTSLGTITTIGGSAANNNGCFQSCTKLESVVLPQMVTKIEANAFENCSKLATINLPSSITSIGGGAFSGCSLMNIEVNLPSLTSLGMMAFRGSGITKILSLGTITSIPSDSSGFNGGCLANCTSLTEVILPNTLTSIGGYAFSQCSNLASVTFPTTAVVVGREAFRQTKISSLTANISSFSSYSQFAQCTSLETADLSHGSFTSLCTSSYRNNTGAFYNCTKLATIALPESCTSIGQSCFNGCTKLATVTGAQNVTTIAAGAFSSCNSLANINMESVRTIETYCFSNVKIPDLYLPSIVTISGNSTTTNGNFYNSSLLRSVDLGENCTLIGTNAFRSCSQLQTFIVRATTPPSLGTGCFAGAHSSFKIYVPYSSDHSIIDAYKAATNWDSFASKIYELDEDGLVPA